MEAVRNYKAEIHAYLKQILLHKSNGKNTYKLLKSNKQWQKRLCNGHQLTEVPALVMTPALCSQTTFRPANGPSCRYPENFIIQNKHQVAMIENIFCVTWQSMNLNTQNLMRHQVK